MPKELRARYCAMTMVHAARTFRSGGYDGDILFFRTKTSARRDRWDCPAGGRTRTSASMSCAEAKFTAHFINSEHNEVVRHQKTAELIRIGA